MNILLLPYPPSVNALWRKRDIDNVVKAVFDLLEHHEILENDSLVHDFRAYWSHEVVGVQVIIKNLAGQAASE